MTAKMALASEAPAPSRLFFSDAKLSFIFPAHWRLQPGFPYGPLFAKPTKSGREAVISCAISAPLSQTHLAADIPAGMLKDLARKELESHQPGFTPVAEVEKSISGHRAYEIIWDGDDSLRNESVYFFIEDRIYAVNLKADSAAFRWLSPDFHNWLKSIQILSRRESGALNVPAHGGLWIHQTGGLKVILPEAWLIGVSDDHTLGAVIVQGNDQSNLTASWDGTPAKTARISSNDKKALRKAIHRKGYKIDTDQEFSFHGFPALQVTYEGPKGERYIIAEDLLVATPKGNWLFSFDADSGLFRTMCLEYQKILKDLQFI